MQHGDNAAGAEPRPRFDVDSQVGFLLRRVYHRFHANLSGRIAKYGLTPQQIATLGKIAEVGSVSQNQLGRLVAMDPAAIHGVIRRLGERGLIRQQRHPSDQRMLMVSLTEAGAALLDEAFPLAVESQRVSLAPLSAEETRTLTRLLHKLSED